MRALPLLSAAALLLAPAAGAHAQGDSTSSSQGSVIPRDGGRCDGTGAMDTIVAGNEPDRVSGQAGDDDIELDAAFPSGSGGPAHSQPSSLGCGNPRCHAP